MWKPGRKLLHRAQRGWGVGIVIQVADEGRRLAVRFAGREGVTVVSGRDPALLALPDDTPVELPGTGPLESLARGHAGPVSAFALRARVARLEALRRADALGALFSSRVHVLPHQVGAAGRILSDRMPRFVLADEVGLGKTVEAGLVFAGLRQLGLAEKVLVAVPEHLSLQWLAELFHKLNVVFGLITPERIDEADGGVAGAIAECPRAIVAFEHLRADPALREAAAAGSWDLVIVDEAHHLVDESLFAAIEPIARGAFGLLLLTATPVRLDPREYFRLLSLVEPVPTATPEAFLSRITQNERFAAVARTLLADRPGKDPLPGALEELKRLAPGDPAWEAVGLTREGLLAHIADRYSLSTRLIRNRRAMVGTFTKRVASRTEVAPGRKAEVAADLCATLARSGEKVLVFGADVAALRTLRDELARRRLEGLLYDDAPTLEARDRLVARFRDPEGPMILLSGESGGEGRNFQFCSHMVCYDLPDSPLVLEQRIGRLDRLGQSRPVQVHVLPGTAEERFLADLYQQAIGIFDEPVGGLDTILASLPGELAALRERPPEARERFRAELAARVGEGRRVQREGYDPLLDLRSAALPELGVLTHQALERLGEAPEDETGASRAIEDRLRRLSRWLEEELESVCIEIATRAGIEVDTDQNVAAFETAFTLGSQMRIEALPGMQIPDEPETLLGSFWRDTAVTRDELHWFATGHRLVEALIGLVRDGDAGRSAALVADGAPPRGALVARYLPTWPTPADLEPGALVPSRQASRYLDASPIWVAVELGGRNRERPDLAAGVEEELAAEEAPDARDIDPPDPEALAAAEKASRRGARDILETRRQAGVAALGAHMEREAERLGEAHRSGGASLKAVAGAIAALEAHRAAIESALHEVSLELDAAALLVAPDATHDPEDR